MAFPCERSVNAHRTRPISNTYGVVVALTARIGNHSSPFGYVCRPPLLQERCASSVIAAQIVAALFYDARWNQREQPVHVRCTDEGRKPPRSGACGEDRSEEHTSELQSLMRISYAVFCLKKKKKNRQYLRNRCKQNLYIDD